MIATSIQSGTALPWRGMRTPLAWFVAYVAVGALVVTWQPANGSSVWYPPIAIGMALLLRHGARWLPLVFFADFLVSLAQFDQGWGVAAIVAGNTAIEVLVAATLLRAVRFDAALRSGTDFLWLVLAAGGIATCIGATLGSILLGAVQPADGTLFSATWRAWWIGDATGVIVLLPAILMGLAHPAPTDSGRTPSGWAGHAEIAIVFGAAAALCGWVFSHSGFPADGRSGYEMLVFLPVAWSAIRCGPRTTAMMIVVVDLFATALFLGHARTSADAEAGLVYLQLFMVALSLAGVPLAISIDGLRAARESLRRHGDRLATEVQARTLELEAALVREQHANTAKSDFLANISHELRTPMHAIRSFARLGLERSHNAERDKLNGYFERIDASSLRLLALLNDLLDLSKLEAGRMELELKPLDLSEVAHQSLDEAEPLATARDIELSRGAIEAGIVVVADRARLQQVLLNVLSNAIKFSHPGSRIDTTIAAQTVDNAQWAVLTVTDAGVGVPQGELEAIFDKFVQSSTTRSGAGGTGLGLAICREILRAHNGTIHAEHAPAGGTRLVIRLPA